jgi:hypothetical protein
MTRADLAAILREILESPPGERPRLLNAILSYREKSQVGHASETQSDPFANWLRQCLREACRETSYKTDSEEILELIQKALGKSQIPINFEGSNAYCALNNKDGLPDDSTIRGQIRKVFDRIDQKSRL